MRAFLVRLCFVSALGTTVASADTTPTQAPPAVSTAADIVQPDKDWKLFGIGGTTKTPFDYFFLPTTLRTMPDGTIQVWTKQLDDIETRKIDAHIEQYKVILNQSAAKVAQYYHPPFADLMKYGAKDAVWVTELEIIADNEVVAPDNKILFNIDCADQRYRYLSIVAVDKKGRIQTTDQSGPWVHVVPESMLENLTRIVCAPTH